MSDDRHIFLFVIWSKARRFEGEIRRQLAEKFTILHEMDVCWPWWHFTEKLLDFYKFGGWFTWWNKARKCGRGPFRVILIEDSHPIWSHRKDTRGRNLLVDDRVYQIKKHFRKLTGHSNIVHSSVTREETEEQLQALFSVHSIDELSYAVSNERLGTGRRRICYRLRDSEMCLKSYFLDEEIRQKQEHLRQRGKPGLPLAVLREIATSRFSKERNTCVKEYQAWLSLKDRLPAAVFAVFPEKMELVFDGARGWCLKESLVLNPDGSVPHSCAHEIRHASSEDVRKRILTAAYALRDMLCEYQVPFFDPPNAVVQWLPNGDFRLRIIDLEPSTRTLIPIDRVFSFLVPLKTRRRFTRYLEGAVQ